MVESEYVNEKIASVDSTLETTNTESTTLAVNAKTRFTSRLEIRCDPETKGAILAFAKCYGLSLCQIYDALTKAFLHGVSVAKDLAVNSPTINLTIERSVKRVRRYAREYREEVEVETNGSSGKCAFCDGRAYVQGFFYSDNLHCSAVYLCEEHWGLKKNRPDLKGYNYV